MNTLPHKGKGIPTEIDTEPRTGSGVVLEEERRVVGKWESESKQESGEMGELGSSRRYTTTSSEILFSR